MDKPDKPRPVPSKQNLSEELAQLETFARASGNKVLANILWLAKAEANRDVPEATQTNINE